MTPLDGIRIIDLSRVVSGPFCTMTLSDMGADVIKIEEPGIGNESRAFGPPFLGGESPYFLSINRNKRSCTVNLKSDDGKAILWQLLGTADVVIENFRPERYSDLASTTRQCQPSILVWSTARSPDSATLGPTQHGQDTT